MYCVLMLAESMTEFGTNCLPVIDSSFHSLTADEHYRELGRQWFRFNRQLGWCIVNTATASIGLADVCVATHKGKKHTLYTLYRNTSIHCTFKVRVWAFSVLNSGIFPAFNLMQSVMHCSIYYTPVMNSPFTGENSWPISSAVFEIIKIFLHQCSVL